MLNFRHRFDQLTEIYATEGVEGTLLACLRFGFVKPLQIALPHPYDVRIEWRSRLLKRGIETRHDSPLPVLAHLDLHRRGYTENNYYLYGFGQGVDRTQYVSRWASRVARILNDRKERADDKRQFHQHLVDKGYESLLPALYGRIVSGDLIESEDENLRDLVQAKGRVVVKPVSGSHGEGVSILESDDEGIICRSSGQRVPSIESLIEADEEYLVVEFCEQATYLNEIYPDSSNTIRLLTIRPAGERPFIAAAAQRIGSDQTGFVDNFFQGGLTARVDLETGELSAAGRYLDYEVHWHETHPDTGGQIEGVAIPNFDRIAERILELAAAVDGLQYLGWDVLVTAPDEFVILEANTTPDLNVHQVHEPLLEDPRVREYYCSEGVISCKNDEYIVGNHTS